MMKPMSKVQRDQLADEYWKWFKKNELKRWKVFSLKDDKLFSNGKEVKTMLKNDKFQEIFNRPILRGKEKKKCNQISQETKEYLKSIGFEIPTTKHEIQGIIRKELDNRYINFKVKASLPPREKIGLPPEIQYRVLRKYIYIISRKLIGKTENKKLTWEKRINLILKKLLIMEKKEMDSFIIGMKDFKVTKIKHNSAIDEEVSKKVIKDFFISGYERMRSSEFKHKFLFKYFPVCPYCNATYLFKLREEDDKEGGTNYVGAQLDHYCPKDDYPYLAISIFNLIPSCPTCNHIKSNRGEPHLHPYSEEMGNNAKFTLSMSCLAELEGIKDVGFSSKEEFRNIVEAFGDSKILDFYLEEEFEKRVELKIKGGLNDKLEERIENSKEIFQLENKYSGIREEIRDLYFKHKLLNQSQREETLSQFGDSLGITPEQMEEVYYGARKEHKHKRPLSKFINDIRDFLKNED